MATRREPDSELSGRNLIDSVLEYWWLWIGVAVIAGVVNLGAGLLRLNDVPLNYPALPFTVLNRQLTYGDRIQIVSSRCNTSRNPITYEAQRRLVRVDEGTDSPSEIALPTVSATTTPGCTRSLGGSLTITPDIPPGVWVIVGEAVGQGRLGEWRVLYETEPFEVVRR